MKLSSGFFLGGGGSCHFRACGSVTLGWGSKWRSAFRGGGRNRVISPSLGLPRALQGGGHCPPPMTQAAAEPWQTQCRCRPPGRVGDPRGDPPPRLGPTSPGAVRAPQLFFLGGLHGWWGWQRPVSCMSPPPWECPPGHPWVLGSGGFGGAVGWGSMGVGGCSPPITCWGGGQIGASHR